MAKRKPRAAVPRKRGRPAHQPTKKLRAQVLALAGIGTPHNVVADIVGISERSLEKHYATELRHAVEKANGAVASTLFAKAVGGDTSAAIFWCKTRLRWRENDPAPIVPPQILIQTIAPPQVAAPEPAPPAPEPSDPEQP